MRYGDVHLCVAPRSWRLKIINTYIVTIKMSFVKLTWWPQYSSQRISIILENRHHNCQLRAPLWASSANMQRIKWPWRLKLPMYSHTRSCAMHSMGGYCYTWLEPQSLSSLLILQHLWYLTEKVKPQQKSNSKIFSRYWLTKIVC